MKMEVVTVAWIQLKEGHIPSYNNEVNLNPVELKGKSEYNYGLYGQKSLFHHDIRILSPC